jgi:hypothetical protein
VGADRQKPQERRAGVERRAIKRQWFPVADGLPDHFEWLHGARLQVFLVVARATKFQPTWRDWTLESLARDAKVSVREAARSLRELAADSPMPLGPDRKPRRYIVLRMGRGAGARNVNAVRILKHIRGDESGPHGPDSTHNPPPVVEISVDAFGESGPPGPDNQDRTVRIPPIQSGPHGPDSSPQVPSNQRVAGAVDPDPERLREREESDTPVNVGYVAPHANGGGSRRSPPSRPPEPGPDPVAVLRALREQTGAPIRTMPTEPLTPDQEAARRKELARQAEALRSRA